MDCPAPRVVMKWNDEKDLILCKEILITCPFRYKERTQCRGSTWKALAVNLNAKTDVHFKVDGRSVRDRWNTLKTRKKKKIENEVNGHILEEPTELDMMVEELILRDEGVINKKEKDETKIIMDESELKKRMELVTETHKRTFEEDSESSSNKRQNTSTSLEYLKLKMESEERIKQNELDLKRREQDLAQEAQQQIIQQIVQQQNSMLTMLSQQMELTRQLLLVLSKKT